MVKNVIFDGGGLSASMLMLLWHYGIALPKVVPKYPVDQWGEICSLVARARTVIGQPCWDFHLLCVLSVWLLTFSVRNVQVPFCQWKYDYAMNYRYCRWPANQWTYPHSFEPQCFDQSCSVFLWFSLFQSQCVVCCVGFALMLGQSAKGSPGVFISSTYLIFFLLFTLRSPCKPWWIHITLISVLMRTPFALQVSSPTGILNFNF